MTSLAHASCRLLAATVLAACQPRDSSVGIYETGGASQSSTANQDDTNTTVGNGTDAATSRVDGSGDSEGEVKLDVGPPDLGPLHCPKGQRCDGCTAVDLLFVIDNSVSMNDHQVALGQAFPSFAEAIVDVLPPNTSLHVAVTSTTMGDSSSGATTNCVATGDDDQPASAFYTTPDVINTGVNGAQGRLFEALGQSYFATNSSADATEIEALSTWFTAAANIGESGSQVEMSAAGAGWATHPANDGTNAGFLRDEGAVLVIFFIQDEPDQTPDAATNELVDMIAAAKAECGGMECVVGGGFVDQVCLPEVPLGVLFDSFGAPPVIESLPQFGGDPSVFEPVLVDTLAQVIAQTCEKIPPAG